MKNIFFLILYVSMFSFSHSAKEGDLDGAWRAIEAFINGERQEAPRDYNEQVAMIKEITGSA